MVMSGERSVEGRKGRHLERKVLDPRPDGTASPSSHPMPISRNRLIVVALVATHALLLLAYTLPQSWVPTRLQGVAQRYVRPLFHQQWNLFAPDPPLCACSIEVGLSDGIWQPIISPQEHYLVRRMARPLADHIHDRNQHGDTVVMPVLAQALRRLTRDLEHPSTVRFRSVSRCVVDPAHPEGRSLEIIELVLP